MKKLLLILPLFFAPILRAQNATLLQAAPVAGLNLPKATYLGTGSANTAKTTGAITLTTPTTAPMVGIVVIGCSGNFATSNWAAAVTDSASNTYVQIGANTGTYPQANGTTQNCVPFFAKNKSIVTTITFTISGSSSANTTVSLMAWGVANIIPNLSAIDGWTPGTGSAVTAFSTQILVPSHSNELLIVGGCASTGTITLPSTSALSFDTGSIAIASGANNVTNFGGSAVLGDPVGVTGSFTDGSSASYSEVAIVLKGYDLTDSGHIHLSASMVNGINPNISNVHPELISTPMEWAQNSFPASGNTAQVTVSGVVGKLRVVTGWCAAINGDTTGAASQQVFEVWDSTSSTPVFNGQFNNPSGAGGIGRQLCVTGRSIAILPGHNVQALFGGNVAHALEEVDLYGYDIDVPNITY